MSRRVSFSLRLFAGSMLLALLCADSAAAQTTVVLDAPDSEVVDTTIRAGSFANTNLEDELALITRSSDNSEYKRRALLKFDTSTTIPARATIRSATVTLTLGYSGPDTRTISVYRTASSWDEEYATWNSRRTGQPWGTAGGDLAGKYAQVTVGSTRGSKVTIDVTRLVQEVVNGNFGSRYTRIALSDDGPSSSRSYKEFLKSESSDASVRPRLTVVWGGTSSTTTTSSSTTTTTSGSTTSSSSTGTTVKVLHWNVHHGGIGTDGRYDPDRIATWIAKMNPDVASLNEVDTTDQMNAIISRLQSKTGKTWRTSFSGRGNLVITRLSVNSSSRCVYPDGIRYSAHLGVMVNGRPINVWSTHLTVDSASKRLAETQALQKCASTWPQALVLAGDYNMQVGSTEYNASVVAYRDTWAWAKSLGVAVNYSGNCDGCTRNSRIDYIFTSKYATFLALKSAQMVDTRDGNGVMPSDHKPLLVAYAVN